MKKTQALLSRVQKYRERKGLKIIDTKSRFYKIVKALYILSFVWFAAIHISYFIGEALVLSDPQKYVTVYMPEFYIICVTTALTVAGFIFTIMGKQAIGGILNLIALPIDTYQYYILLILRNKNFDSMTKFIWCHLAPAVLMVSFCGILCLIAARAQILLNRDYKRVLEALYITHQDKLGSGTEQDWENLLVELDDDALEGELELHHTREYQKKKGLKETRSQDSEN